MSNPVDNAIVPEGAQGAKSYAFARDLFQSYKALALLASVEEGDDNLGYRVQVRVVRGGPNWRVEAGVFTKRFPLFPRQRIGSGRRGGGMKAAHGNRTGFQDMFERIIRPLHLAVLLEGSYQRAILRDKEMTDSKRTARDEDVVVDDPACVSNLMATESISIGLKSSSRSARFS